MATPGDDRGISPEHQPRNWVTWAEWAAIVDGSHASHDNLEIINHKIYIVRKKINVFKSYHSFSCAKIPHIVRIFCL